MLFARYSPPFEIRMTCALARSGGQRDLDRSRASESDTRVNLDCKSAEGCTRVRTNAHAVEGSALHTKCHSITQTRNRVTRQGRANLREEATLTRQPRRAEK